MLAPGHHKNKKIKEERSQFLCVRGGESVISSLFSCFGDALSPPLCPVPQPWPKRAPDCWWGVACAAASLGMLQEVLSSFLISSVSLGRMEGGRGSLAKPFASSISRAGWEFRAQLCLQSTAFPWQLLGLKVGF